MEACHLSRAVLLLVAITPLASESHSIDLITWPTSFNEVAQTEKAEINPGSAEQLETEISKINQAEMPRSQLVTVVTEQTYAKRHLFTISEAVQLAMGWHPVIKRAEREYAQSIESTNEAKAGWYPSLSARIKSGLEQNNNSHEEIKSNTLELNASQVLYDFGKISRKIDLADTATYRARSNLDKSVNDIAYETAKSFVQAIHYQLLIDIARLQVKGLDNINRLAEKRAIQGASAESDYSQSKVRLAAAIAMMHDYEAQSYRWNSVLDNVTNASISTSLNTYIPKTMDTVCSRVDMENLTSPAIELAQAQINMAKVQVNAFKAEYYPTISINPTWEYELENRDDNRGNRAKKGEWGIFLNVSAPIYEGGARMSRTQQAEQALLASQFNLDTEKTEVRRKIAESRSQITSLNESMTAKQLREKEAIRTRDLYKLQYLELGNRSFSDLLSAESEIHQTRMDILNSQYTITMLLIDCLYYSGNLTRYFSQ
ncbi:TPA: TolC family protein [Enterobacter cloacae]|nr:TolC family protein [Enterobacter cloacae]